MRILKPAALIPAAVLLVAMSIAACGGDDNETQITDVITTSARSTDPADCTKLETQQFAEQTEFATGADAVTQCQQDASNTSDNPDSVDVKNVKVDGDNGTADVTFHGGAFDGSTLTVALIKQGSQWRLDKVTAIPTFNLAGFAKALTQRLVAEGKTPEDVVNCIGNALNQVGADEVKAVLLSGDSSKLTALFAPCG